MVQNQQRRALTGAGHEHREARDRNRFGGPAVGGRAHGGEISSRLAAARGRKTSRRVPASRGWWQERVSRVRCLVDRESKCGTNGVQRVQAELGVVMGGPEAFERLEVAPSGRAGPELPV